MGKFSRDKGNRLERWLVNCLHQCGYEAERVPLSGAMRGSFGGDVRWKVNGKTLKIECKSRAAGFKFLYDSLAGHNVLVCKTDRAEPLVIMKLDDLICLIDSPLRVKELSSAAEKAYLAALKVNLSKLWGVPESLLTLQDIQTSKSTVPITSKYEQLPIKSGTSTES